MRSLRALATWVGWTIATLQITDLLEPTTHLLDSIYIDLAGDQISILTIINAILTLLVLFIVARIVTRVSVRQINKIDDMTPSLKVLF
jgi:hypothetical protein